MLRPVPLRDLNADAVGFASSFTELKVMAAKVKGVRKGCGGRGWQRF